MKKPELKKLEEQATIYITLSMMLSLSANYVSEFIGISFIQYVMISIAIVFITLGGLKVSQHEKQKKSVSCKS